MKSLLRFIPLGLVAGACTLFSPNDKTALVRSQISAQERMSEDLKVLEDPKANGPRLLMALSNLSRTKNPAVLERTLALLDSPDFPQKAELVRFLANYEDPRVLDVLVNLARSGDKRLRLNAVRTLVLRKTLLAREKIDALLKEPRDEDEKMLLLSASTSPEALEKIFKYADSKDEKVAEVAYELIYSKYSSDPRVEEKSKAILAKKANSFAMSKAIFYLAQKKSTWLKDHFRELSDNGDVRVRLAMIDALPQLCPDNRLQILAKTLHGDPHDMAFSRAYIILSRFQDAPSKKLLSDLNNSRQFAQLSYRENLLKVSAQIQSQTVDPCQNPAKSIGYSPKGPGLPGQKSTLKEKSR